MGGLVVALAILLVTVGLLILPRQQRLWVSVTIALVWWTIARLPEFPLAHLALTTAPAVNLLLILFALGHPRDGWQARVPRSVLVLPVMAGLSVLYVQTVVDRDLATYARVTWLSTTLAALAVAGALDAQGHLRPLLRSFAAAGLIVISIFLVDFAVDPTAALSGGYTRFAAWGGNPNAVGPVIALGLGALLAVGLAGDFVARLLALLMGAAGIGLVILTASRGNLLILGFAVLPLIALSLKRRPVLAGGSVAAITAAAWYITAQVEATRLARLTNLEGSRDELASQYAAEVIERPFFGLMFSAGERHQTLIGLALDEHNSYLRLLYIGGVTLFLPIALISLMALRRGFRWLSESTGEVDQRPMRVFVVWIYVGMLVYGYTNRLMYEPFGVWPFVHALFVMVLLKYGAPGTAVSSGTSGSRPSLARRA